MFIATLLFVLGVLIFVHELGHFLAAKAVGIAVPRFSIGFGPPTPLRFRRGETEYMVSWVPLGGYVKMASREEQEMMAALEGGELEETFPPEQLFESKPLWARILVISAGVIMNVLFAWGVYSGLAMLYGRYEDPTTTLERVAAEGLPEAAAALAAVPSGTEILRVNGEPVDSWGEVMRGVTDPTTERLLIELDGAEAVAVDIPGTDARARGEIASAMVPLRPARAVTVSPGEPAEGAGVQPGDLIVAVDGQPIAAWGDLVGAIQPRAGERLVLTLERDGRTVEVSLVPAAVEDPANEGRTVGQIGIGPLRQVRFNAGEALVEGARRTWGDMTLVIFALKGMFTGHVSPREIGGPILIGQAAVQFARRGFRWLMVFMALLSVNLAVLNLLPIPVLDGGHLVFLVLEGLRGRPLTLEVRQRLTQVGLVIILCIMVFAVGNDLLRQVGW